MQPKISVIIPVYNVEKYLRECLDSVISQTLREMEIICVDDGSTDSSPDILREYCARDDRISVITKQNSGYGNTMNRGLEAATGEYIGIVESDDHVEQQMFERLYEIAKKEKLDVVKSGFYFYYSMPKEKNVKVEIVSRKKEKRTFCPTEDFATPIEMADFFNIKPSIWSAIYRREFLLQNEIRFLETPGASYQDTGFNFKVMTSARRVQLVNDAYLHYRQDNETSSVNSGKKVFCICDEYEEMAHYLEKMQGKPRLDYIKNRMKYDAYMWNLERLSEEFKRPFFMRMVEEFRDDEKKGKLSERYFDRYDWKEVQLMIQEPETFYDKHFVNPPGKGKHLLDASAHWMQRKFRRMKGRGVQWKRGQKSR